MNTMYQKSFLKTSNFTKQEIEKIIKLSFFLKKNRNNKTETKYLKKKKIALIFEKESTRTRCAFEIASIEQGAYSTYLGPGSMHLGYKESIIDTIKVFNNLYDGIQYRGYDHNVIKLLSRYAKIPIWNGLTNKYHPTQLLADLLTILEFSKKKILSDIICTYIGDASNNVSNSLLETASIMNFQLRFVAPKKYWPNSSLLNKYKKNNNIICTENIIEGVKNTDYIYTDVWVSMGEPESSWEKKISLLRKYQVNKNLIKLTNNPNVKILHCLPSFHDKNTILGKKIAKLYKFDDGIEITNEIFSKYSTIIFQQSENRLHTIKALMISTLIDTNNIKF